MKVENEYSTLEQWARQLEARRLTGVVGALLKVTRPLAPVGAGLLWVAQPALGLVMDRGAVARWARFLENPDAVAWLDARLSGEEPDRCE
jgi:hypothetical protein